MKHIYILYQLHFFNEQRILLTFSINSMQHNTTLSNLRYPFNYPFPPHTIHYTPLSTAKTCYKTSTSNKKKRKKKAPHPPIFPKPNRTPLPNYPFITDHCRQKPAPPLKNRRKKKKKKGKHLHPFTFPKPNRADQTKPKNHPTLSPSRTPSRSSAHAFSRGLGKRNPRGINCIHGDATEQSRFIRKQ